ncbi:MAG: hypothetical protein LBD41_06955 [Clostridiales Family XIII bacterium]|jgi:site-specific recombinase|nr:hypothetical protein [Clostridiales Family XIII bacterium]
MDKKTDIECLFEKVYQSTNTNIRKEFNNERLKESNFYTLNDVIMYLRNAQKIAKDLNYEYVLDGLDEIIDNVIETIEQEKDTIQDN